MTLIEMGQSYRKLEGANVARMEGRPSEGRIVVTYANGYVHSFRAVAEVEAAERALYPSRAHTPIAARLLFGIIGAPIE